MLITFHIYYSRTFCFIGFGHEEAGNDIIGIYLLIGKNHNEVLVYM